uniref:Uncharacterized protein n=1 Tax=Accipiter nisus TaxID=211598 RepID=A0A8B9M855_9AVES
VPLISSPPPFCPCSPWRPARPGSPWHCGWPRCWGPHLAGSPTRSAKTRGPASHRNHLPPAICSSSVMLLRSVIVIFSRASSESASLPSPPVAAIPASAAEAAAALLASSSCRCLCSSMETRRACGDGNRQGAEWGTAQTDQARRPQLPSTSPSLTRASSGSALGSTPNSKSLAPRPSMAPPSPARMGELMRASARLGPGGTVTRWEPVPSLPFKVLMKAVSLSVLAS